MPLAGREVEVRREKRERRERERSPAAAGVVWGRGRFDILLVLLCRCPGYHLGSVVSLIAAAIV